MTRSGKLALLVSVTVVSVVVIFCIGRIAQDQSYHHFADTRSLLGIPNFGNVVSNIPFLLIGLYGIVVVGGAAVPVGVRAIYLALFLGVTLTGLGSAYYHWNPNNDTLVWDRIPMTIVFMSFLAASLSELVSRPLGTRLLLPLIAIGVSSVLWWHYTETVGRGDLRPYGWVQFYPIVAVALLLVLFRSPVVKAIMPWLIRIVIWYAVAKVLEQLDFPVYRAIGVSGHSLKHLAAAGSTWYFVRLFRVQYFSGAVAAAPL
jgi:hypothetical protein